MEALPEGPHRKPETGARLSSALAAMVGGSAGPLEVRVVVAACHRLAKAYLRTSHVTNRQLAGLTLDDQAMDAIGDLFRRSGRRFPVLEEYVAESFQDVSDRPDAIAWVSRDRLIEVLRPLVHGAVTDRLFESNGEVDASLSRIIRNVKRAVRASDSGTLDRSMRALRVVALSAPTPDCGGKSKFRAKAARPTVPVERLAARLGAAVRDGQQVPDLVEVVLEFLSEHPRYAPSVPVTAVALAIRSASVEVTRSTEALGRQAISSESLSILTQADVEQAIGDTVAAVHQSKRAAYVESGKLTPSTYAAYFDAIRSYLDARYLPPTDPSLTQHEALRLHQPDVDRASYRERHRAAFEYLMRAARTDLEDRLRRLYRTLRGGPREEEIS